MTQLAYATDRTDSTLAPRGLRAAVIVLCMLVGFAAFWSVWQRGLPRAEGSAWTMFIRTSELITAGTALGTGVFVLAQARGARLSRWARLAPWVWIVVCVAAPLGDLFFLSINAMGLADLRSLPSVTPDGAAGLLAIVLRDIASIIIPIVAMRMLCERPIGVRFVRAFIILGALACLGLALLLLEPLFFQFIYQSRIRADWPAGLYRVVVIERWTSRVEFIVRAGVVIGAVIALLRGIHWPLRVVLTMLVACLVIYWGTEICAKSWEWTAGQRLYGTGAPDFADWMTTVSTGVGVIAQRGGWAIIVLLLLRGIAADQIRLVYGRNHAASSSSDSSPAASERNVV